MSFKLHRAVPALLLAISAGGVVAQPPRAAGPDAPPAAIHQGAGGAVVAPTSSASAVPPGEASGHGPVYRSVFDGYRAFTDQPVLSWRESNDLVGRIGGWKAYAREAQQSDAPPAKDSRPSADPAGDHAGHGR